MPSLYSVLAELRATIDTATDGLISQSVDTTGQPLDVQVGIGWPSIRTLQDNVRKRTPPTAIVSITDRGMGADSTRWGSVRLSQEMRDSTLTATLSAPAINAGQSQIITLGGAIVPGDAVAVLLTEIVGETHAQIASVIAGDTLATVAARLAGLIAADEDMSAQVTVQASGSQITLTSLLTHDGVLALAANCGNGGTATTEIGRRSRDLQVVAWTRTEDDRIVVADAIDHAIASMQADYGMAFDGLYARVTYGGDRRIDGAILADTYRQDFLLNVEYPITTTDELYAILAPISRVRTF